MEKIIITENATVYKQSKVEITQKDFEEENKKPFVKFLIEKKNIKNYAELKDFLQDDECYVISNEGNTEIARELMCDFCEDYGENNFDSTAEEPDEFEYECSIESSIKINMLYIPTEKQKIILETRIRDYLSSLGIESIVLNQTDMFSDYRKYFVVENKRGNWSYQGCKMYLIDGLDFHRKLDEEFKDKIDDDTSDVEVLEKYKDNHNIDVLFFIYD